MAPKSKAYEEAFLEGQRSAAIDSQFTALDLMNAAQNKAFADHQVLDRADKIKINDRIRINERALYGIMAVTAFIAALPSLMGLLNA